MRFRSAITTMFLGFCLYVVSRDLKETRAKLRAAERRREEREEEELRELRAQLEENIAETERRQQANAEMVSRQSALLAAHARNVRVSLLVLARDDLGALLMVKQGSKADVGAGLWTFPLIPFQVDHEDIEEAVSRALAAEGVPARGLDLLGVTPILHHRDEGQAVLYLLAAVMADRDGDPARVRWVLPGDVPPEAERHPATNEVLARMSPWSAYVDLRQSVWLAKHHGETTAIEPVDLATARDMAIRTGLDRPAGKMLAKLAGQVQHLRDALAHDRTGLARGLDRVVKIARAWHWTRVAGDSKEDEAKTNAQTYQAVMDEIHDVATRGLRDSGILVRQGFHGEPLTPREPMSAEQAALFLIVDGDKLTTLLGEAWERDRDAAGCGRHWAKVSDKSALVSAVQGVLRAMLGMTDDGAQLDLFQAPHERPEAIAARLVSYVREEGEASDGYLSLGGVAVARLGESAGLTLRDALRTAVAQDLARGAAEDSGEEAVARPGARRLDAHGIVDGKYLVLRRDGSTPRWPYFVLGAKDPAAGPALATYADVADALGFDAQYVADVRALAARFMAYRENHGTGNPDAPLLAPAEASDGREASDPEGR